MRREPLFVPVGDDYYITDTGRKTVLSLLGLFAPVLIAVLARGF